MTGAVHPFASKGQWIIDADGKPIGVTYPLSTFEKTHHKLANLFSASPELLSSGKNLAIKLSEIYRAAGQSPDDCAVILDWMAAVAKVESRS